MSRGIHVITKSCTSAHIESNLAAIRLADRVPDGCLEDADGSEMVRGMVQNRCIYLLSTIIE